MDLATAQVKLQESRNETERTKADLAEAQKRLTHAESAKQQVLQGLPVRVTTPERFPAFFVALQSYGLRHLYQATGSPLILAGASQGPFPRWAGSIDVTKVHREGDHAFVSVRIETVDEEGEQTVNSTFDVLWNKDLGTWQLFDLHTPGPGTPIPIA